MNEKTDSMAENLQAIHRRIAEACAACGRASDAVRLLAVSKTVPCDRLKQAWQQGQRDFGENYVTEALEKQSQWGGIPSGSADNPDSAPPLWHLIGPLQANKTRPVAEHFDWVHSLDRLKIAQRLSAQRPAHLPALQVCVQVNISEEDSKSGVSPAEAPTLCQAIAALPRLQLRGLMAIPDPALSRADTRAAFEAVRALLERINARSGLGLDTLSMGMSADFDLAIAAGATWVRVGSALFGERARPAA